LPADDESAGPLAGALEAAAGLLAAEAGPGADVWLLAAGGGLACAVWVTVVAGAAAGVPPDAEQAVKPTAATATAAAASIRDFAAGPCMLLDIPCLPVPSGRCPVRASVRRRYVRVGRGRIRGSTSDHP
jgi:hypothetical protein